MSKQIIYGLCVLLIASIFANDAYAQRKDSVLFVAPTRLEMGPKDRIKTVVVTNKSERARRYDINIIEQEMNEQGLTETVEQFKYSAKSMLRFVPKRFTLEPNERQVVRVMVRRKANIEDGDYHSHMLFREVPVRPEKKKELIDTTKQQASFSIPALYGLAIPVVVQQGNIESDVKITDAKLINNESLAISFDRSGNAEGTGRITVEYGGKSIAQRQWIRIYRERDTITRLVKLDVPEGVTLSGGEIKIDLLDGVSDSFEEASTLQTFTVPVN